MKRIVAFAAAFLLVIIIMGLSINYMGKISETNRKRREIDQAKNVAASMAAETTETMSIYDYLRTTEATQADSAASGTDAAADDTESEQQEEQSPSQDTPLVIHLPDEQQ